MISPFKSPSEEDCSLHTSLSRRSFLKSTAVFGGSSLLLPASISARPTPQDKSETLAAQLYRSLDEAQKALLCHEFEDSLRQKVDNNWLIFEEVYSGMPEA